jgi:hypothetical protein
VSASAVSSGVCFGFAGPDSFSILCRRI